MIDICDVCGSHDSGPHWHDKGYQKTMNHVVSFSGGIGSWAAAKRVKEQYGTENLYLLFCDTLIEDEDLYRFIKEAADNIGGKFVRIADGRDPFQVFKDVKYMGNSRVDPCSKILKRELADQWLEDNFHPCNTFVYVGIDWSEIHRYERLAVRKKPWIYKAPLCEPPFIPKEAMIEDARAEGLTPPRLYSMGFPHNNCGGFCVKAGQAQFKKLFENFPERYLEYEEKEQQVFKVLGKPRPFIRVTRNKKQRYLSMREFREEFITGSPDQIDLFDYGGCGCFLD